MVSARSRQLVLCVSNRGFPASLERRRVYVSLRDAAADKQGLIRVIDESGEDYLYPTDFFGRLLSLNPPRRP